MENNQQNQQRVFWSKNVIIKGEKLEDHVLMATGTFRNVTKRIGQTSGKPYMDCNFEVILGDKTVGELFGQEYVNPDHKVTIRFNLNGFDAENFEKYPPMYGQYITVLATQMSLEKYFSNKEGREVYYVKAGKAGFINQGSTKDAAGNPRKPVQAFDATNAANGQAQAQTPMQQQVPAGYQQQAYAAPVQQNPGYAQAYPQQPQAYPQQAYANPAPAQGYVPQPNGYAQQPQVPVAPAPAQGYAQAPVNMNNQFEELDYSECGDLPF